MEGGGGTGVEEIRGRDYLMSQWTDRNAGEEVDGPERDCEFKRHGFGIGLRFSIEFGKDRSDEDAQGASIMNQSHADLKSRSGLDWVRLD